MGVCVLCVHAPWIRDTLSLAEFRCIARENEVTTRHTDKKPARQT